LSDLPHHNSNGDKATDWWEWASSYWKWFDKQLEYEARHRQKENDATTPNMKASKESVESSDSPPVEELCFLLAEYPRYRFDA